MSRVPTYSSASSQAPAPRCLKDYKSRRPLRASGGGAWENSLFVTLRSLRCAVPLVPSRARVLKVGGERRWEGGFSRPRAASALGRWDSGEVPSVWLSRGRFVWEEVRTVHPHARCVPSAAPRSAVPVHAACERSSCGRAGARGVCSRSRSRCRLTRGGRRTRYPRCAGLS